MRKGAQFETLKTEIGDTDKDRALKEGFLLKEEQLKVKAGRVRETEVSFLIMFWEMALLDSCGCCSPEGTDTV